MSTQREDPKQDTTQPLNDRPLEDVPRGDHATPEEVERAQDGTTTGTERKTRGPTDAEEPDRSEQEK